MELSRVRGVPEDIQRRAGINLTGGNTNAMEICNQIFNYPSPQIMLAGYLESKKKVA
jgi:hypothetical protein